MNAQLQRIRLAVTGKQSVTAVLAGIAAVAGSFAAAGLTEAFAFTPVSSFVVHNTPAVIINTTLDVFGAYGQLINMSFTLFVTVALFTVATGIALELGRHSVGRAPSTAVFVWLFAFTLTGAPLLSLGSAVPAALVVVLAYRPWKDELSLHEDRRWPDRDRRQLVGELVRVPGLCVEKADYACPVCTTSGASDEIPQRLLHRVVTSVVSYINRPESNDSVRTLEREPARPRRRCSSPDSASDVRSRTSGRAESRLRCSLVLRV